MAGGVPAVDGRVLRGRRNRDAVVEAFLSLIEEGDQRPTARAIAERAGLSVRSVFKHFADLEEIYEVAGQRQARRLRPLLVPVDPELPLRPRIAEFVRRRGELLRRLDPVARAARLREPFSEQLQANREVIVQLMREQCAATFLPELALLPAVDRDRFATAVATASSWAAWYHLRNDQGLGDSDAAAVLRILLQGVLDGALSAAPEALGSR